MIKAEISEIKKLFAFKNCAITRICGCYVNGDKDIINTWAQSFLAMDEEDLFKYLEVFKKCLGGAVNKTLFNVKPTRNICDKLHQLTQSKLKDNEMLMEFYQHIIDNYEYVGNYLILVIHDVYDIPGKGTDNMEMTDASDEVYEYILACICPVSLAIPALGYDKEKSIFTHIERDWLLKNPEMAILYPAFNDRSEDRKAALYSVKSMDSEKKEFAERALGSFIEMIPSQEKDVFHEIIDQTLGYDKSIHDIQRVSRRTRELAEEKKYEPDEGKVGIEDIRKLLTAAGISKERIGMLDRIYTEAAGSMDAEITLENVVNRRKFTINTGYGTVSTKPEHSELWEIKNIDGKPCLILELDTDTIEVDGMDVNVAVDASAGSSPGGDR